MSPKSRIYDHLNFLYGETRAQQILPHLEKSLSDFSERNPKLKEITHPQLSERDAILITYGDQISDPEVPPLQTLAYFLNKEIQDDINGVHLLPFYPYSSDDGFSVIDYRQVDPNLGTWEDISH